MIKEIRYSEIECLIPSMRAANLTIARQTVYLGFYHSGKIVGVGGYIPYKSKAILKNFFVLPEFRGQGIFKAALSQAMVKCNQRGIGHFEAICTPLSIKHFLNIGFKETFKYKNGCIKVIGENIP